MVKEFWFDLDGVHANFSHPFEEKFGSKPPVYEAENGIEEFWLRLREHKPYFYELPKMPKSADLIKASLPFKEAGYKMGFLTAGPKEGRHYPWAREEKISWVRDILCLDWEVRVVNGGIGKKQHAKPGAILVDDSLKNIEDWNEAGGIGVFCKEHAPERALIALTYLAEKL